MLSPFRHRREVFLVAGFARIRGPAVCPPKSCDSGYDQMRGFSVSESFTALPFRARDGAPVGAAAARLLDGGFYLLDLCFCQCV